MIHEKCGTPVTVMYVEIEGTRGKPRAKCPKCQKLVYLKSFKLSNEEYWMHEMNLKKRIIFRIWEYLNHNSWRAA